METLKIISIFKSVDGEAYHAGRPTIFLRTWGCNLRCAYPCDTRESWDMETYEKLYDHPLMELAPGEARRQIQELARGIHHVTITGGEPLLPENVPWMQELCNLLLSDGFIIDIETNGAASLADMAKWRSALPSPARVHFIMDWKCSGSKMLLKMLPENLGHLRAWDVVKCVVTDADFPDVEAVRQRLSPEIPIYISPCFGNVTMNAIPEFVLEHSVDNYVCQLQQHKYFWNPAKINI